MAYSDSGSKVVNGNQSMSFSLPEGNYYINLHFNYNSGSKVTGTTTWNISGATTIYNNNGTGNYGCNALFQGLFHANGGTVKISWTNNSGITSQFPYELVAYKA